MKNVFTTIELAEKLQVTPDAVYKMNQRNQLPEEFVSDRIDNKLVFIKTVKPTTYINPKKLSAEQRIALENANVDFNGNVSAIQRATGINYFTIRRYLKREYKPEEAARADKNKSRKLSSNQIEVARKCFNKWLMANAQKNVRLALYHTRKEIGVIIPRRIAYSWADSLTAVHTLKHYYKDFISKYTYHHRRDLWAEYDNFLDCVVSDVWKIDDPYVPEEYRDQINKELDEIKEKNVNLWEKVRTKAATAYALVFMDVKTRYPLEVCVCPHSVTSADVKKGMLSVIMNWGNPNQWLLDNGHEFINKETMDFLYGIYMGHIGQWTEDKREKKIILKEDNYLFTSRPYHPQGKGMIEAAFEIFKTQWAVYSISYSPNQFESRKPGLALSSVQPVMSFEQLAISLREFVYGDFIEMEREMFLDPGKTNSHPVNQARPKTIKEAFDLSYRSYEKRVIDDYILNYHYSDKRKGKFRNGCIKITDSANKLVYRFVPDVDTQILSYAGTNIELTVLFDHKNMGHAWIFDGDKLLGEANDLRLSAKAPLTKERATMIGKIQRQAIVYGKKQMACIDEVKSLMPMPAADQTVSSREDVFRENVFADIENKNVQEESSYSDQLWEALDLDDVI